MVTFYIYWKLIIHVGLLRVRHADIIYVLAFFLLWVFTLILFWQWVRSHCCFKPTCPRSWPLWSDIKSTLFDMVVCPFEVVKEPLVKDCHLISLLRLSLTCSFIYSIISQHTQDIRDCCTILLDSCRASLLSLYIFLISF